MPLVKRAVHEVDRAGSLCGAGVEARSGTTGVTGSTSKKSKGGCGHMGRLAGLLGQRGHEGFGPTTDERKEKAFLF
jgi:hypothetical protein